MCGSLQKIGDGILAFIEEQRSIIVNLLADEDGVSLESALEHQCQSDVDTQEWLSTKMINYVISQARSQQLRFALCYLYEKSSNTGTVRTSIIHGVERKSTFLNDNNDDIDDYVSDLRPNILPAQHPETYLHISSADKIVTYPVIGGMMQTVQLPCSGTSECKMLFFLPMCNGKLTVDYTSSERCQER